MLLGHILVASGVPGYRGVSRSMHLGGRLRTDTAQRIWPGWLEQYSGRAVGFADVEENERL